MTALGLSIVVIGRNEGSRLVRCFQSIQGIHASGTKVETIYVDSGSTDGSPEVAESFGAKVIVLKTDRPTAALGRDTGWRNASSDFILFLDGIRSLILIFLRELLGSLLRILHLPLFGATCAKFTRKPPFTTEFLIWTGYIPWARSTYAEEMFSCAGAL